MRSLICLLFLFSISAFAEQGTMTPDDSEISGSEASLSGYELPENEEVQLIEEEEFDPMSRDDLTEEEEFYLEEEASEQDIAN